MAVPSENSRDLAGAWRLTSEDIDLAMAIPGDVHSALEAGGVIPDPYFGANEAKVQWVSERDWLVSRTFDMPEAIEGSWYLDLDFVDTVATVRVNGIIVLEANNCFRRYRPDVTAALKEGENLIEVLFHSPIESGRKVYDALPFEVPWLAMNCPIPYGNMLRKPQCHFGWDWNIALAPSGLYGTAKLRKLDPARIEHVTTRQHHRDDGSVELDVAVTLYTDEPSIVPVRFSFNGEEVRVDCAPNPGETTIHQVFVIERPKLWWPAGSGEQTLYPLTVALPDETVVRQIGLRRLELLTDRDEAGSRFAFRINGREIFARGANWIPADALFSRTRPEKTEALLQSAVDANMNMIRIWGGGFYEHDWFYDLCDRLGLMVWQDFMFACNLYPSTQSFLDNVEAEVDYQVRRLAHHASIVLWCGDNELVGALNWFEVSKKDRDRYLVSYDRLNRTIERALEKTGLDAIWWPSSPSVGPLDFGDAWHKDGAGDMHFWSVWHENKSFDHYRTVKPRFCSEFGFQSYTSNRVLDRYTEAKDRNIASPVMEVHQKNPGGNERIAGTMFRYFRFPKDFANFVYLSQIQQGLAIKTAVEYWRSLKPHCMGTVIWQLNDTWPVASWASLDYGGTWKAMHYQARRFFAPETIVAIPSGDGRQIALSMINDGADTAGFKVEVVTVDLDGRSHPLMQLEGQCPADRAAEIGRIDASSVPDGHLLVWSWTVTNGGAGRGHHVMSTYKVLDLKPSGLALHEAKSEDGQRLLTLSATGLALFVMVEADCPGRFSDNAFDLFAGESRTISFMPDDPDAAPRFTLRDLHSCQATE